MTQTNKDTVRTDYNLYYQAFRMRCNLFLLMLPILLSVDCFTDHPSEHTKAHDRIKSNNIAEEEVDDIADVDRLWIQNVILLKMRMQILGQDLQSDMDSKC